MSSGPEIASESTAIQEFIRAKQADVLQRAIDSLRTCGADELVAQTHRISGTLGTYQLDEQARAVRTLYDALRAGVVDDPVKEQRVLVSRLEQGLDDVTRATEGSPTP